MPGTVCPLPDDLAGTIGHVLYRYTFRGRGKARQIQPLYVDVDPETRREALLSATRACVESHPASGRGSYGSNVRFQAFHYVERVDPTTPRVRISPGRSIPRSWLREMHEQELLLARRLMSESGLTEMDRPGVQVWSNAGSNGFREIIDGMDSTLRAFDAAFPGARPAADGEKLTLLVFKEGDDSASQLSAFSFPLHAAMVAPNFPTVDPVITTVAPSDLPYRFLAESLARDLARHMVTRRLAPAGKALPYWVVEGLSTFYACLKWVGPEDAIDLSAVERQWRVRGFYKWRAHGAQMFEMVSRFQETGKYPSFTDLPATYSQSRKSGPKLISGVAGGMSYPMHAPSWIAVHFLLNAENGKYREAFQRWMEDPGIDKSAETLSEALGRPIPFLDQDLADYIKATW